MYVEVLKNVKQEPVLGTSPCHHELLSHLPSTISSLISTDPCCMV